MNIAIDSTQQALYAAILANPLDDAPRLIYADYLDEIGQSERATFIRAQIELEAIPYEWHNRYVDLCLTCENWLNGPQGKAEYIEMRRVYYFYGVKYLHGFVGEVRLRLSDWEFQSKMLVSEYPISTVVVADKQPQDSFGKYYWRRPEKSFPLDPDQVPLNIWEKLKGRIKNRCKLYDSIEDANKDLSDVLLNDARQD